ncbi:zinc-binding alcohol dehydrogenase family protein [Rhodococcus jostii]|uniref:quinone oxidoreductase family protein n=1 Tax=Rhodococcus jostii TaxID=132919 RepID=UPI0036362717
MRAITISRFGEVDVLEAADLAVPEPGPGQVSIDVSHAAVGLADVLMRRGEFGGTPPIVPGLEVAGTVREVGAGVHHLRVGQPVVTLSRPTAGGYAEVSVADAAITIPLDCVDPRLDAAEAVAVIPNTTTALLSLERVGNVGPGSQVLIHGAAGALSGITAQVARRLGAAQVLGTVRSSRRAAEAERYGYDLVVSSNGFRIALSDAGIDSVDIVVDPVGGRLRAESLEVLAPLGRLLAVGNASGEDDVRVGANELWLANRAVLGFNVGGLLMQDPTAAEAAARRAIEWVAAGTVSMPHTTLPLAQAAEAHRVLESGDCEGRIVLTVPD